LRGLRHFVQFVDEDCSFRPQTVDHEPVVNDLVTDIDRSPVSPQGELDDLYGAVNAGTKASWRAENDIERWQLS
jgi:hypothetical protein